MTLLLTYVAIALIVSFSCSILEATLLSARTAELLDRKAKGSQRAALLLELKGRRAEEAIGAILTLNTIAHTVGSTLAGAQAAVVFGDAWVGVFSGVLTFLVLVVTEIVPKTLGTVYASNLGDAAAVTIDFLIRVQRPVLAGIGLLTRWIVPPSAKPRTSRGQVAALAASAASDGTLSEAASRTVANVLRFGDLQLRDVVVPRNVVTMQREESTISDFLNDEEARRYARVPLFREVREDADSYVLQRDVLAWAVDGGDMSRPLCDLARPALLLPESQSLERALESLTEGREQLALVFDEHASLVGIVTVEDLVEAALGVEIVDETDSVVNLRAEARRLVAARWRDSA